MLMRDRNHPSVVFWSIGNEIDGRRSPTGVAIAKQLHHAVKKIDTTRPVTMAVPGPYDHNLPEWQATIQPFFTWMWAVTTTSGSNTRSITRDFPIAS